MASCNGTLAAIAFTGLLIVHADADQGKAKAKGHDKHKGGSEMTAAEYVRGGMASHGTVGFSEEERHAVRGYVTTLPETGLPPGLARKNRLPPGLEKQLRRNGRLPPGLEKKLTPFPAYLESRFPPLPPDYGRGFISGRAVIYNRQTNVILDSFMPF
jgi:hypothetical protein